MTIFAVATAPGRAAIAIIRISGERSGSALQAVAGSVPRPRVATLRRLSDPVTREAIDDALVLWFPGPASFTGEDMAELHLHGGRAVIDSVLAVLGRVDGLAPAEPGDFTRRAFANGKLDLTAAEGLADLIDAETEAQRRQALRQLDGELGALVEGWRARLIHVIADLEVGIDFPDEDLPPDLAGHIAVALEGLVHEIRTHLADGRRGERLREGWRLAILGPPNVGKSSLLNRLARRDVAIVAPEAGTTRDVIEVHLDIAGYPVLVADTAGLRDADSAVEREGVRRAKAWAESADIKILMSDSEHFGNNPPALGEADDPAVIRVWNKADVAPAPPGTGWIVVSCRTGLGLDRLIHLIAERLGGRAAAPPVTRPRHRVGLETCVQALERARMAVLPELAAEDLRLAARALGRITGRIDVDDILDAIFAKFCIGK